MKRLEIPTGCVEAGIETPPRSSQCLRILHLIASAGIGGGERYILRIADQLDRQRFHVEVGCWEGGRLAPSLRAHGIPCHAVRPFAKLSFRGLVVTVRWLRELRPDVLVTHSLRDHLYGRIAAKLIGTPAVISTYHVTSSMIYWDLPRPLKALYWWVDRLTLPWVDGCVCLSRAVAEDLASRARFPAEKIRVVTNVIDPEELRPRDRVEAKRVLGFPEDAYVIGIVARLSPEKKHSDLFHAVSRVQGDIPEVRLAVVGEGAEEKLLRVLAERLGLADIVSFLGFRDDVASVISAFDVAVLPSMMESAPTFLLEALALGKPVIATRVGGVPELMVDGVHGRLVKAGDVDGLSQALLEVYSDRVRAKGWGDAGREWVLQRYTPEQVIPQLEAVYRGVLEELGHLDGVSHGS